MSAPVFEDGFDRFTPIVEHYRDIDPRDTLDRLIGAEGIIHSVEQFAREQRSRELAEVQRHMQDMYQANRALGEYCVDEEIDDIILIDRSARPIWNTLSEYLTLAHPDAKRPRIHFINPFVLDSYKDNSQIAEPDKDKAIQMGKTNRKVARQQLVKTQNDLANLSDARVLLMDACVHSGRQMQDTRTFLSGLGIKNLRLGVFTDSSEGALPFELDFSYTSDSSVLHCKPYGKDLALHKALSIYSGIEHDAETQAVRNEARTIDRELIRHFFAAEQAA